MRARAASVRRRREVEVAASCSAAARAGTSSHGPASRSRRAHHLAHGRDVGRDARDPAGHRLEQHGGQAVGVAVRGDDEGGGEQIRLLQQGAHLLLRAGAQQLHRVVEAVRRDAGGELLAQRAVADDRGGHRRAPVAQRGDRVDQQGEALLLHEAADGEDLRHGPHLRPRQVGEALELEAVAHQVEPLRRPREAFAQVVEVVAADGDRVVGAGELRLELRVVHVAVEDVLRVGGEGVGQAGDRPGQAGDRRGHRREVGVEVGDAVLARQAGDVQGLLGLVGLGGHELVQRRGGPGGQDGVRHRRAPGLPQPSRARRAADGDDRGLDPGELGMEAGVGGRAQGEDDDLLAGGLAGEDLRDDEGLGEARVHLQHVPEASGLVRLHGCAPPGGWEGGGRGARAAPRPGAARPRVRRGRGRCARCSCRRRGPTRR